jgi:type VI protein secretion system component VasK
MMQSRTVLLGNVLVAAGAIVGVATVTAIATGYQIVLTPEMIRILIYKGLAAAALGLMVAGTWIGRRGRRKEQERQTGVIEREAVNMKRDDNRALAAASPEALDSAARRAGHGQGKAAARRDQKSGAAADGLM